MGKYLTIFLLFSATWGYSQKLTKMTHENILGSTWITPEFEKFDSIRFEQLKKDDKDIEAFGNLGNGRNIVLSNLKVGKSYGESIPNSFFYITKLYYTNNNIKEKGLAFIYTRFKKGTWYYFDEYGKLSRMVDYDEPFKFTFEQVLQFCEKEGIHFKTTGEYDGFYKPERNRIFNAEKNECYWMIVWFNDKKEKIEEIRLDGKTGKEISRTYMDYII